MTEFATLPERNPEVGELVQVRSRQWLVDEVIAPEVPGQAALVHLSCADDDNQGQELKVFWGVVNARAPNSRIGILAAAEMNRISAAEEREEQAAERARQQAEQKRLAAKRRQEEAKRRASSPPPPVRTPSTRPPPRPSGSPSSTIYWECPRCHERRSAPFVHHH